MELMDVLIDAYSDDRETHIYTLNLSTGKVTMEVTQLFAEDDPIPAGIKSGAPHLMILPATTSFERKRIMQEFIIEVKDTFPAFSSIFSHRLSERKFREKLIQFNLIDRWQKYLTEEYKAELIQWLKFSGLSYEKLNDIYLRHQVDNI